MATPGSQYSLSTQEEMEMDYYDYNVINASAAPGSYLGMDPAFLVWIPPIDDSGKILSDSESEDIMPVHSHINPGSGKGSPEGDKMPVKPPRRNLKSPLSEESKAITSRSQKSANLFSEINLCQKKDCRKIKNIESLKNQVPPFTKSDKQTSQAIEKETIVIRSPNESKISKYYEISDIKFADDDEEIGDSSYRDIAFELKS